MSSSLLLLLSVTVVKPTTDVTEAVSVSVAVASVVVAALLRTM